MTFLSRMLAPAVLAAGFGFAALVPAPAQAQDDTLARVLVDVADVVLQGGQPYYRYGNYGANDRVYVQRDRFGRPVYYRVVPSGYSNSGPPYGNAYGYYGNRYNTGYYSRYGNDFVQPAQRVKCNSSGNCTVKYYDPQYDRRGYQGRYDTHRGHRDGRRERDDD